MSLEPADVLGKYPHQLSGGQLQRLMIARALLLDIKFLVADEIISMLDASTRIDVLNLLGDLKERGVGILFITHDLSLGNYISDKTLILRRGRVVEMGATAEGVRQPGASVHADAPRRRAPAALEVGRGHRRGRLGRGTSCRTPPPGRSSRSSATTSSPRTRPLALPAPSRDVDQRGKATDERTTDIASRRHRRSD